MDQDHLHQTNNPNKSCGVFYFFLMPIQLFQDEGPATFQINEKYAKRFEHNKKREELQQLQEKYKQFGESESSSTSEEEDEFGELITPEIDVQIVKTISAIKNKDEKVYDPDQVFFKGFKFLI